MLNFDFKKAATFKAVKWERNPIFRFVNFLKKLSLILFIFLLLVFIYGFLTDAFEKPILSFFLGLTILSLTFSLIFWLEETFFNSKLKNPKLKTTIEEALNKPEGFNFAEFLSFKVAKAVFKSIKLARHKNYSEINSTHLFYNLISDNPEFNFVFFRVLLNLADIKKLLKDYFKNLSFPAENKMVGGSSQPTYSEDFQETISESLKIAQKKGHQRVEIGDLLTALSGVNQIFKQILINTDLKAEDIENLTWWLETLEKNIEWRKKFWEWKNLIRIGSVAKAWAAGYTITLDQFGIDYSEIVAKRGFPETIGHKKAIEIMERNLAKRESSNNVLIVGEAGSGRKSMIEALAKKSVLGESFPGVNHKRIVQLDLISLATQIENSEDIAGILDVIFREALSAGNIILVIDEFHNFIGTKAFKPGVIDISGVLAPYLSLPQFQVVAITTFEGLHKNIEQNSSLLSLFEKVEISEISEKETLMLLERLALFFEQKYNKFISYPALRNIINYCAKYLPATPFPEKAIELLDEVMVHLAQTKDKVLLPKHIAKIVSEKTQIPVGEMEQKEREILLDLENLIHQRIINQEEAVKEVSAALRRARAEVTVRKGPMGCFLFMGPTGVGKTETAKALSEIYFGSEERMIRLDMSEFQDVKDIPRLIGSPGEEGFLTTKVRETPFALILLDEIEKAHPNILNLFLQVLDEGYLTDGLGRKVDFKHSIIIATSNAGYLVILEAIKKGELMAEVKDELIDFLFKEGVFRPEFLNRFDAVIIFRSLTKENLLGIAELLFQKLKKNLKEKDIDFVISQELKEKIVELGYNPTFGAREMRRVIQDRVENVLAPAILSGEIKRGYRVEIDPNDFKLIINP